MNLGALLLAITMSSCSVGCGVVSSLVPPANAPHTGLVVLNPSCLFFCMSRSEESLRDTDVTNTYPYSRPLRVPEAFYP